MSYSGIKAKIPIGEYGMISDFPQSKVTPNGLLDAKNIVFTRTCAQKAPGARLWNSGHQISDPIVAVYFWEPVVKIKQRIIAVSAVGDIYKGDIHDGNFGRNTTGDDTPINATIASTLTPNCVFAEGGAETAGREKKLFLFTDGATKPYVLTGDGTAFTAMSNPSSDWSVPATYPKFGVVHRNRLWAFAGQISYASDSGDHESFNNTTTSLVNPVYAGEGSDLRGGFVYKGRLMCFKDGGFVYMLNDLDSDETNWYWQKLSSNFGLCAPNAIVEVLDNFYAGNMNGTIGDYGATQSLGGIEAADLAQECQIEQFVRELSKANLTVQHMMYYPAKKLMFVTYGMGYSTYNNMLLVFDFSRKEQVRPSYWTLNDPSNSTRKIYCLGLYKDVNGIHRPMVGTHGGVVFLDQEDRVDEFDANYEGSFQIPHLDFSHMDSALSSTQKNFDFLAIHYIPEGNTFLSCDYFIDGRYIETIRFPLRQYLSPVLDTMTLDTDRLAQANEETSILPISGSGRTFSARFYNSGTNESFQVTAITVFFRPGGQSAQKV